MRDPAFDPPQAPYDAGLSPHVGAVPPHDAQATPSMAQYIEIKTANPDCLLFYRMGDFYELFFEDAEIAARILGIVLTKRGKHAGADIPMCGVPVVRADDYLQRLIGSGLRVAVCEQLEDPAEARKRGSKSIVKRDVVRIVTPGTITEEGLLDARRANILASLARQKGSDGAHAYALAMVDISTGALSVADVSEADLSGEIARLDPREMLLPDALREDKALEALWRAPAFSITRLAKEGFDATSGEKRIAGYFGVASLEAYGAFSRPALAALGAIIAYLERTQLGARPPLSPPRLREAGICMAMDAATRANLELTKTLSGQREGSLLSVIDRSVSPAGGRLIAQWLAAPSTDLAEIRARQEGVSAFVADNALREDIRAHLVHVPDILRAMARVALERAGPRDLAAIAIGLIEAEAIAARLSLLKEKPERLITIEDALLKAPASLGHEISRALREDIPLQKRDGGFIRAGYDAVLDAIYALRDNSRAVIAAMQARYAEETQIRALKIKHNSMLGFYIEVAPQPGETLLKALHAARFFHRQTMAGAMRFSTAELSALDQKIAQASAQALARELEHFAQLSAALLEREGVIRAAAEALGMLDAISSLAELASVEGYTRPILTQGLTFVIEGGRHPVVEHALNRMGEPFIANDCTLSPEGREEAGRILLVTGANMAGKSTYLRQNALIVLLAQMGSYVPAKRAEIGLVDRLFSRVGAADDLARGRSTFMVEMVETAAILNQSGPSALVILDEIGRGTATYDGLSIAWAAIEHLHDANRCRALFATHFHELTALCAKLNRLKPVTMKVATHKNDVVFLHEVIAGAADRSYGIEVAKLAGLPQRVVARAGHILKELEKAERASPVSRMLDDLPLFSLGAAPALPEEDQLRAALAKMLPDDMSPKAALEALYRLKALAMSE